MTTGPRLTPLLDQLDRSCSGVLHHGAEIALLRDLYRERRHRPRGGPTAAV
jgi:hypothetical protein